MHVVIQVNKIYTPAFIYCMLNDIIPVVLWNKLNFLLKTWVR